MEPVYKRRFVLDLAWEMYGTPYLWGGDDPIAGVDCSGFVIELLKSVGILPHNGDWKASQLWEMFQGKVVDKPSAGCLAFYENRLGEVVHVELCWDEEIAIGASGGGSATQSLENAIRQNAYVKFRPIEGRHKIKGFVDPFKLK